MWNSTLLSVFVFKIFLCCQLGVECVRLHPEVDLENSLANNIAVLRLGASSSNPATGKPKTIASVVNPRNAVDGLLNRLEATGCSLLVLTPTLTLT